MEPEAAGNKSNNPLVPEAAYVPTRVQMPVRADLSEAEERLWNGDREIYRVVVVVEGLDIWI